MASARDLLITKITLMQREIRFLRFMVSRFKNRVSAEHYNSLVEEFNKGAGAASGGRLAGSENIRSVRIR